MDHTDKVANVYYDLGGAKLTATTKLFCSLTNRDPLSIDLNVDSATAAKWKSRNRDASHAATEVCPEAFLW